MAKRRFEFEIYRINKIDRDGDLFLSHLRQLTTNLELIDLFRRSTNSIFDSDARSRRSTYRWSLRNFLSHQGRWPESTREIYSVCLARSVTGSLGMLVTDNSIVKGLSHAEPAPATVIRLIVHIERHLLLVEQSSVITNTNAWRNALHTILDKVCEEQGLRTQLRLEPIPQDNEVMAAFRSFDILLGMRATIRLPNPEISRSAKRLHQQMEDGAIDEWLVHLKSKNGLNRDGDGIPGAVASMAQAGYKSGSVQMYGVREGKYSRIETGKQAMKFQIAKELEVASGAETAGGNTPIDNAIAKIVSQADEYYVPDDIQ